MAINPETQYPGKIAPSTPQYPYGQARNITLPGDGTGTPWEAALVNDIFGFQQALLTEGAVVPSGTPDEVGASQYLDALNKIVTRTYGTVEALKLAELPSGIFVKTGGYYDGWAATAQPRGAAIYSIATLAEVRAQRSDPGWTPDELVNHTLANGNVAVVQYDTYLDAEQAGARRGGTVDATANFQAAIDWANSVIFEGLYLIDPATSVLVRDGTTLVGKGQQNSGLLADFDVAGSVIHREFTEGVPNDRVNNVQCRHFSVFLNHVHQATVPANIQQGFNFRDITRSTILDCYSGNFRFGEAATLFPNAGDKTQAMRGYPFVLGNRSAGDVAYAGGEVNRIMYCRSWWARKGITLDDQDLTGGVSATYNALIYGNDIQTVEVGINQGSQFNTGCSFTDNLIQDLKTAAGSTNDVFVYDIAGFDNRIGGGYVETADVDLTACIHFATTANNNIVDTFYHTVSDAKFVQDDSSVVSENIVRQITETDKLKVTEGGVEFRPSRAKGYAVFDGAGTDLNSQNVASIVDIGVGDTNVNWRTDIGITTNSAVEITCRGNGSGQAILGYARTHSGTTTRVDTYNVQTSSFEDVVTTVTIRG